MIVLFVIDFLCNDLLRIENDGFLEIPVNPARGTNFNFLFFSAVGELESFMVELSALFLFYDKLRVSWESCPSILLAVSFEGQNIESLLLLY